ncbi:hypothetical protein [Paracoccus sp. SM22M-07]|uniref:hypothetical protein n=1 Tax=Paracoccus sp. SM22M-07 TaxID=1520813 RepID=UPI000912D850|nr:hypothetical protein [Paracoccus sp. SM22M-07]OJH43984.1 hypothetical protein IE00_13955 [Paracoccus sp. SM22M-07]
MTRRNVPQSKINDAAFPVRLFIVSPGSGVGRDIDAIYRWLNQEVGRDQYAIHSAGRAPGQNGIIYRIAIYLKHPKFGAALLSAFPSLELADGTLSSTYTVNRAGFSGGSNS